MAKMLMLRSGHYGPFVISRGTLQESAFMQLEINERRREQIMSIVKGGSVNKEVIGLLEEATYGTVPKRVDDEQKAAYVKALGKINWGDYLSADKTVQQELDSQRLILRDEE